MYTAREGVKKVIFLDKIRKFSMSWEMFKNKHFWDFVNHPNPFREFPCNSHSECTIEWYEYEKYLLLFHLVRDCFNAILKGKPKKIHLLAVRPAPHTHPPPGLRYLELILTFLANNYDKKYDCMHILCY